MDVKIGLRVVVRRISSIRRRPSTASHRPFSTSKSRPAPLDLAYTRYDPPTTPSKQHPPIIVMHGLFGSQRNNRTLSKVLAKQLNRQIYTIDLRNHGDSPHAPTHTYTTMSEDVEHFIRTHNLPRPILMGHSMGAKVAMTLALRQPSASQYSGVIPVDNSPVDAALKTHFGVYVRGMQEIESSFDRIGKQSEADAIMAKYEDSVTIRQFLLTNLVKDTSDEKRWRWRVPLNTLAKALPDMSDFPFKDPDDVRYEGPVLVIRGGESRYVADETLPVMGRFFPRFELVDVKGAGHWVLSERFEECVRGILDWVPRCVDGGEGELGESG